MNNKKIILAIIIGIILVGIIWIGSNLNSKDTNDDSKTSPTSNYSIWIYQDDADELLEFLDNFKEKYPQYKTTAFIVESFSDYDEYTSILYSAFSKGKGPDLFVLNNSEKETPLLEYSQGINPNVINPNDFRKKYISVLSNDLIDITEVTDGEETKKVEYLKGVPVGYETLGIYYNKAKRIKAANFDSIGALNSTIAKLKDTFPSGIALAIGNGSSVSNASDIIAQFFLLENEVSSINDVSGGKMKSALTSYMLYGDINENNAYNSRLSDMTALDRSGLDLFVKNEVFMIMGYPRLLLEIDEKGFRKSLLAAASFPFHNLSEGKTLINYNYFVKSRLSENSQLSDDILGYLSTDSGAEDYLDIFSYYLPGLLSLESDKMEANILDGYYITLGDFYNPDHLLQSFDVGVKNIYDREIIEVLDDTTNYIESFTEFQARLICKSNKYLTLEKLSVECE